MKKNLIYVKDAAKRQETFRALKKKISDAFSEEGQAAADAIRALIDEIEGSEQEIDRDELERLIMETMRKFNKSEDEEIPAAVANAIAKKIVEVQNRMPVSDKLTPKIKNEISAAILKARGKSEVEKVVNDVLVKNGISGLSFEDTVDYAITENWGESNALFNALRKTPFSKFFYSAQDKTDADVIAHGWDKTSQTEKEIQAVVANGKSISTQYIYKRQQIAQEDLDDMREMGGETNFLRWLNDELDRQIVNTIVGILLGAVQSNDITTIEALMGAGTSDAFRTAVANSATAVTDLTIVDIRKLADAVSNPYGKSKWLVIDQTTLTQISAFIYASGGDTTYHRIDDLKGMLGV
ncbi:MAG: hypothetical protein IKV37_05185, partial [Prevotella sp.]|nr:hypothetical protein [Prevotella sp.]